MRLLIQMFVIFAAMGASTAIACPFCKDAAVQSQQHVVTAGGINGSILFMLGGCFCVIGLVMLKIVKAIRSAE